MIEIGKYNRLRALRLTPPGMFMGKDGDNDFVLLPNRYLPKDIKVDQELDVFVYTDSEDRPIATTQEPKVTLHEFACLRVKDVVNAGAFLDWGLEKDLFVPFGEQSKNMQKGESYLVFLLLDEESNRLVATSKIDRFLENDNIQLNRGDKVDLLIGESSPMGVNVIINNRYRGLIYHNEIFTNIFPGEKATGYIKEIREDNKIDVSLQQQGFKNVDPSAEIILEKLKANNGVLELSDKSDPEDITRKLQMSKKTFKKAIGVLYKQRLILIEEDCIRLV